MIYRIIAESSFPEDVDDNGVIHYVNKYERKLWDNDGTSSVFPTTEELVRFMLAHFKLDEPKESDDLALQGDIVDSCIIDGHHYYVFYQDYWLEKVSIGLAKE